jgi:hypothetical protein
VRSGYEAKVHPIVKRWSKEPASVPMVVTPGNTLSRTSAQTLKEALEKKGGTAEVRKVECL